MPAQDDLTGRLALITGASRGLGRATAQKLGARGATIIAVARTVGGLEELDDEIRAAGGPRPVLTPLDITDGDGIDRLGGALFDRFGKLDLLVHAAAQGSTLTPVTHLKPKDLEKLMAVNGTAVARVIRSLAPLLAQAEAPRALFVTDDKANKAHWGAYGASKAAGRAYAAAFADETPKIPVLFHEPPPMPTALRARTHPGEDRGALTPVEIAADALVTQLLAPNPKAH